MTRDALDDFFIRTQFMQVRCNAASARMPAVPLPAVRPLLLRFPRLLFLRQFLPQPGD